MYYADYHVHSSFSDDCDIPMQQMITKAISLGLKELTFTDHVDYDYPDINFPFLIDYHEYLNVFRELQEKYKTQIKLTLGVEIGLQSHLKDQIDTLLTTIPFDFVIGSSHVVDRLDLYGGDFFIGKDQKNAYTRYFEYVLEQIQIHDGFQVYGHMDYIIRYGPYINKTVSYEEYKDIIDEILHTLVKKHQGLEINTSGYRYKLNQTHPQLRILKRYKELGGEIVTVGSDAHYAKDLCSHFDTAYDMLWEAGFTAITCFTQRKPRWIDLP